MSYPYAERNCLVEPHSYMYSPFQGAALLRGYFDARSAALRRHESRASPQSQTDRAILSLASARLAGQPAAARGDIDGGVKQMARALGEFRTTGTVETQPLVLGLVAVALLDEPDREAAAWLDRLVQRFEVTKKLYQSYPPGFRAGAGSFDSLRLYWLFALALCLFQAGGRDLQYLSTLLKVCDLLCSIDPRSWDDGVPAAGLRLVIGFETGCVRRLASEKGVSLAAG